MKIARRQVHLDFHTSEHIEDIGADFSKEQFQEALKVGHVSSITLFSKCHHGWAYHPSKANEMHPNLKFNLLGEQIEAAHEIGVKTPVYISAGLDEKMARRHPEWLIRNKDESTTWATNFTGPGYHRFCFNSPYLDYLLAQIKEVCEMFDDDGIFLDIVGVIPCYCQNCVATLLERGLDPYDEENAMNLAEEVYANYTKRVRETIDSVKPGDNVFHNGGHIRRGRRDLAHMNTHLELESLPTGGWGYDHFPLSAAYGRTLGMDLLGMTGKFHKSWGEFGGFKHPNALRYETALSAACGAKSSIGDQLHPRGKMDMATYRLIGKAYAEIEQKEPWLDDAKILSDIGVLSSESIDNYYRTGNISTGQCAEEGEHDDGCVRILLEGKYQFDVIDVEQDLNQYKVIVLPDTVKLDAHLTKLLKDYTDKGGKILATGKSGLNVEETDFALDFGVVYEGTNEYRPSYFRPLFDLPSLDTSAFVMYAQGEKVKNVNGTEWGIRENPYFNRSVFRFSSHLHTPSDCKNAGSAIVEGKDGIYIAWQVFEDYAVNGSLILKEMVKFALDRLLADRKMIETNLPAQGIVTLAEQEKEHRFVNHLLYAAPVKRGKNVEIIEDIIPVDHVSVSVRVDDKKIKNVYLAPQGKEIAFQQNQDKVTYQLERLENHQMVVLDY